ncbi:alpha/beta-hydrolase [Meredithblackwellia eburnea MCA 4105]
MAAQLPPIDSIRTIFDPATCIKRGFAQVSASKKRSPAPHNLYYELHGSTDESAEKIVFIMGLNNSSFAWHNQVSHFGSKPGYQVLVFDNRGVGHSDTPGRLYKTSEMALDVVDLLDVLGWTKERQVHVHGVSMGGMIAQELAYAIPKRIASLALVSTKAGDKSDWPSRSSIIMFGKLMTGTSGSPEQTVSMVADTLYPQSYLESPDPNNAGKTMRDAVIKDFLRRVEIGKLQSGRGKVAQMAAVMGHKVSPERLKVIATSIPKVAVLFGDEDELINVSRGRELHANLPGSEYKEVKGAGHALCSQIKEEYNEWCEGIVAEGRKLSGPPV